MASLSGLLTSWAAAYADSSVLRTLIGFAHVGGLVVAGGSALVADRAVFRAVRGGFAMRERQASELTATHRTVVIGLIFVMCSGVLLAAADFDTYFASTVFWIKMGAIALLTLNGALMMAAGKRIEPGHDRAWLLLRTTAVASMTLWLITTLLGAALPNVS